MRILVSNDDGIHARGIQTLAATLATKHSVTVVAPDRERSAMGHALTLHKPLRVDEIPPEHLLGSKVHKAFAVTGTPSDCVKIGLHTLMDDDPPDLIVSGINHGPNLGADVLYSGTVSAALEGALNNIPSVAVSLFNGHEKEANFQPGADFILDFIEDVHRTTLPPKTLINVNIPPVSREEFNGVRVTKLSTGVYQDVYEKRVDPRGYTYYWLAGELLKVEDETEETDVVAIRNQMVTLTPVRFDMTHHDWLEDCRRALQKTGHEI